MAKVDDVEGLPEVTENFRDNAEGETGHAHGHLDHLRKVGDPAIGLPIGPTEHSLKAAAASEVCRRLFPLSFALSALPSQLCLYLLRADEFCV